MSRLRVLLIEDDEDDHEIVRDVLADAPCNADLFWCRSYEAGLDRLELTPFDICLVDYRIGADTGLEFLERAKRRSVRTPMVMLTGVGQRDIDVAASASGAADFLDKGSLSPVLLERTIRYAIAQTRSIQVLADQRNMLETTLESIRAGVAAFDADGFPISSNRLFDQILHEIEPAPPPRDSGEDAAAEARRAEAMAALCRRLEAAPASTIEIETARGAAYEISVDPLPGGGRVLLAVDVTEAKALQRAILRAKTQAEEASTAKSTFLANVTHELRTPMNGVLGIASLLEITDLDRHQLELLGVLRESANNMMSLIEDLLELVTFEQTSPMVAEDAVDMDALIELAAEQVRAANPSRSLDIVRVGPPIRRRVAGDGRRIRQILVNLIGNAAKFAPDGRISVAGGPDADGMMRFTVSDEGDGVPVAEREAIFDRFVQAANGASRRHGGFGLGLAICKEFVEQMRGRIGVEDAPGGGACFWFTLRAAPAEPVALPVAV